MSVLNRGDEIDQGRYIIEHAIGSGGMGQVYQASQPSLNRKVAIKDSLSSPAFVLPRPSDLQLHFSDLLLALCLLCLELMG